MFALPDRPSLIESVFSSKEGSKVVCNLCGDDAQSFIDVIDEVCPTPVSSGEIWEIEIDIYISCALGTVGDT